MYSQDTNTVTFELRGSTGNVLESITHTVYPGVQRLVFDFYVPLGKLMIMETIAFKSCY